MGITVGISDSVSSSYITTMCKRQIRDKWETVSVVACPIGYECYIGKALKCVTSFVVMGRVVTSSSRPCGVRRLARDMGGQSTFCPRERKDDGSKDSDRCRSSTRSRLRPVVNAAVKTSL